MDVPGWVGAPRTAHGATLAKDCRRRALPRPQILDDEAPMKTAILAAGPLALFWLVMLFALPRQFRGFVKERLR